MKDVTNLELGWLIVNVGDAKKAVIEGQGWKAIGILSSIEEWAKMVLDSRFQEGSE